MEDNIIVGLVMRRTRAFLLFLSSRLLPKDCVRRLSLDAEVIG